MIVLIKTGLFDDTESDFVLPLQLNRFITQNESLASTEELNNSEDPLNGEHVQAQLISTSEEALNNAILEEQQLEDLIEKTKEAAYNEGFAESISDIKTRYGEQLEKIELTVKNINDALLTYLKKNEHVVASIVFEAVCKIIGEELANRSKSILVVEKTINAIDKDRISEILISQDDFNLIENLNKDLSSDGVVFESSINQFIFKADSEIKYGGCKIKLIDGYLDASIDSQLKILSKSLKAKADDLVR